jgi:lipopolysaccharide export system protein LptA
VRKYVLILFLLLTAAAAMCQKKSVVNLIKSKNSTGVKINGRDVIKVYQGTFRQDFSTLTSDSAYFYEKENAFDAFGHVIINQGDTLNIYSDKLNYNGNTKIAILTDNVRMVDKDATLTTNHLVYNTATRIGTYTDGGKLVNKDNTLLSKNGYYFAFTRDSYFRYNVSLTTPDALIKTDTMRYNTGSKIAYFYGPTNIYSTKGEKDRDTLYTENGNYNTVVEQAAFGKNNLYRSGTKSLKGDSLFYDKVKGYGRAVKHVTFTDREQKITIKGNLGTYFKAEEHTIVTEDPYIIIVTEQKDTTKTDSAAKADSILAKAPGKGSKSKMNMTDLIKKTVPGKSDTVRVSSKDLQQNIDAAKKLIPAKEKDAIAIANGVKNTIPAKIDTVVVLPKNKFQMADSVIRTIPDLNKVIAAAVPAAKKTTTKPKAPGKAGDKGKVEQKPVVVKDTSKIKRDSVYMSADTIETRILTYKDLKIYQEKQRLAHIRDTTSKPKVKEKPTRFLTGYKASITPDTTFRHRDFFGKPKPVAKKAPKPLTKKQLAADSVKKKFLADSTAEAKKLEPSDTARIRIVFAYHHAKLFKSDLQGKADSMYYSYSDSTIRCYVNPMMWAEGSQLSGDTIHLQLKNKKMDNMTMFPHAFIVNIEKTDSVHFNQIAGKRMRGYFKENKLHKMFIDGNAESIYFSRDSGKTTVNGMERSLSTRISVDFVNNQITSMGFYIKPEHKYGPMDKFKEDDKILKGFIWKPKDRPVSKESIIPSYNRKKEAAEKAAADKIKKDKGPAKKPGDKGDKKMGKDSTNAKPDLKLPGLKKDSTLKTTPSKIPGAKKDSTIKSTPLKPGALKNAKDSTQKAVPVSLPAVKVKKDSSAVKSPPGN